jgi:AraC-like DNA-binding protein
MRSVISSGHDIACRTIYDYELIYLEKGEFTLIYDGTAYICQAGDVIFIRPNISHSFHINRGDIYQPHIHFDITFRPQSEKIPVSFKNMNDMTENEKGWIHKDYFASYPRLPIIRIKNKEDFLNIFYRIISKETEPIMKKALMTQLISRIINDNFPTISDDSEYACIENQVKDYIDAGNGLTMKLEDFSKHFCYSKFYLEKKFKESFGMSLIQYRNKKRMLQANDLLEKHSVTEVSEMLGYQSIYSFSRAYKAWSGISPSKR